MNTYIRGLISITLMGFAYGQKPTDALIAVPEQISPKWHAVISKTDGRLVTVTVDLKSLSQLRYVSNLRCTVELLDKNGHVTATKELSYTDLSLPSLKGGRVYSKEFKLADNHGVTAVRGVSMSGVVDSRSYVYQDTNSMKGKT